MKIFLVYSGDIPRVLFELLLLLGKTACDGGSVVERSPVTRVTQVRFPTSAPDQHYYG